MKKYEVSVTAEIFFDIDARDEAAALAEARRRAAKIEKGFPTPGGEGRVGVMTYARDKGDFEIRDISSAK
jgi:hypothetical protein